MTRNGDSSGFDPLRDLLAGHALQTRTVFMFGEVTETLAQTVMQQLLLLASRSQTAIQLVVNAQGGTVAAGEGLFDLIRGVGAPIKAIAAGTVGQAAVLAFVAPPREQRVCLPHARFTLFQHWGSGRAPATGSPGDLAAEADQIAQQKVRVLRLLARQTGQPLEALEPELERQRWLDAPGAVRLGLAARVIEALDAP